MSYISLNSIPNKTPISPYDRMRNRAQVDLKIKKIFLSMLIPLNIAGITAAYYLIITYCPIKAEPLIISSFIVGVLGGLISLKIKTFGITGHNLSQFVNPVTLIGRLLAYVFFGPILLARDFLDWTNYANPEEANRISGELETQSFSFIAEHYGAKRNNLIKYGFIDCNQAVAFQEIYRKHLVSHMKYERAKKFTSNFIIDNKKTDLRDDNPHVLNQKKYKEELDQIETNWNLQKTQILLSPQPRFTMPAYEKSHIRALKRLKTKINAFIFE